MSLTLIINDTHTHKLIPVIIETVRLLLCMKRVLLVIAFR